MPVILMQFNRNLNLENQLLRALTCAVLTPVCHDDAQFTQKYFSIFPVNVNTTVLVGRLMGNMEYPCPLFVSNHLDTLINNYLIPRYNTENNCITPNDYLRAFQVATGFTIQIHNNAPNTINNTDIHILYRNNAYGALINDEFLTVDQRNHYRNQNQLIAQPFFDLNLEHLTQCTQNDIISNWAFSQEYKLSPTLNALTEMTLLAPNETRDNIAQPLRLRTHENNLQQSLRALERRPQRGFELTNERNELGTHNQNAIFNALGLGALGFTGATIIELACEGLFLHISYGAFMMVIPFPISLTFGVVGGVLGYFGTSEANAFQESLKTAFSHMTRDDFVGAKDILDKITAKNWFAKTAQTRVLTKEHYAMHHFLSAVCDTKQGQAQTALSHYQQAQSDAHACSNHFMEFLSYIYQLKLLHTATDVNQYIPAGSQQTFDLKEARNNALMGFSTEFSSQISDLHHQLINYIRRLAVMLQNFDQTNTHNQAVLRFCANELMQFNDTYLFLHYKNGQGNLLILFIEFFKGIVLSVLGNRGLDLLDARSRSFFPELTLANPNETTLQQQLLSASKTQMEKTLIELSSFKKNNPSIISRDTLIAETITYMSLYLTKFIVCYNEPTTEQPLSQELNRAIIDLGITEDQLQLLQNSVRVSKELLALINQNSLKTYISISSWLSDIPQNAVANINAVDNTANPQDTELHYLARLPLMNDITQLMVHNKFQSLKSLANTLNHINKSPLDELPKDDPYALRPLLQYEIGRIKQNSPNNYNVVEILTHFQKAADLAHPEAQAVVNSLIDNPGLSSDALLNLGRLYHKGEHVTKNHQLAMQCFQRAADLGSAAAHYELGLIKQNFPKDYGIIDSTTHFQIAANLGHRNATNLINNLVRNTTLQVDELLDLGRLYYRGEKIPSVYSTALAYFQRAAELGSATAHYNLGVLYRHGHGVQRSLLTASEYWIKAVEYGYTDLNKIRAFHDSLISDVNFPQIPKNIKKRQIKAFERVYIYKYRNQCIKNKQDYLVQLDNDGQSLLHRSAKQKNYKTCARLILFGASTNTQNSLGRFPFHTLNNIEQLKIMAHQQNQLVLNQALNQSTVAILSKVITIINVKDSNDSNDKITKLLNDLYANNLIKPLLELAKLAALKLHDKANRRMFVDQDYDSDDEQEPTNDKQGLCIMIDPLREHVEAIYFQGKNGHDGTDYRGVYVGSGNTIYIGGKRKPLEVRGTIIHELTHLLADEVFKNYCDPYMEDNISEKNVFQSIVNDIQGRKDSLPDSLSLIKVVFDYNDIFWHSELIVRVPQIIVSNPEYGLSLLTTHVPELLKFYQNSFLPKIVAHTVKLRNRAMSYWSEELFPEQQATVYFDSINKIS